MSAHPYSFTHPEKERVEHLLSVKGDLERAHDALSSLIDRAAMFGSGGLLAEAVFTVAVVAFVRCFATGRRKGLSQDIFDSKPRLKQAHEEFKSIRDQHIAHAVGVLENLHLYVAAEDESSPAQGVSALGVFFSHVGKRSTLLLLRQVVRHARTHTDREIAFYGDKMASDLVGKPATLKASQHAFRRAIGEEGVVARSIGLDKKMMNRAPRILRF